MKARIRDAGNITISTIGTIDPTVEFGTGTEIVTFKVVERLEFDVVLRCSLRDKHVECIRPQQGVVKLYDGTTVTIARKPPVHNGEAVLLLAARQKTSKGTLPSRKITVQKPRIIKPESKTFVTFMCVPVQEGLILVEHS